MHVFLYSESLHSLDDPVLIASNIRATSSISPKEPSLEGLSKPMCFFAQLHVVLGALHCVLIEMNQTL